MTDAVVDGVGPQRREAAIRDGSPDDNSKRQTMHKRSSDAPSARGPDPDPGSAPFAAPRRTGGRLRPLVIAAGMALALATAGPAARAADWTRLETPHFRLLTTRDDDAVREDLEQLERFRWLALQLMGADDASRRAQSPFDIVLLQGQHGIQRVFPALHNAAGVYWQCQEGATAFADYTVGQHAWNLEVLQHEYAHHLMFQYETISYPSWYVEGFAEFVSTAGYDDGAVTLGAINWPRLQSLRWEPGTIQGWMPIERLLRWGTAAEGPHDEADDYAFYAMSWLLTHYMYSDKERASQLPAYFQRVAAGEDPADAFVRATGIRLADLEARLKRYSQDDMKMIRVSGADLPHPEIHATPLGDDADRYLPDATLLGLCEAPAQAQAVLARLRAATAAEHAPSRGLRLALARGEAVYGDAGQAIAQLDALAGDDAHDADVQYLLGRAWGRRADALGGDAQAAARDQERSHLIQAYRLRKNDAPTLYFLALALARRGLDSNVLNAARGARMLLPSVPAYALYEAKLDLMAGDRDWAVRALGPLASNPHDPKSAARMRRAIEAIRAGRGAQDVNALLDPPAGAASAPH